MKGLQKLVFSLLFIFVLALPVRAECSHDYILIRQEPTCEVGGVEWQECQLCGNRRDYRILDPLGHEYGQWYVLEDPTCTRTGSQFRECLVCSFQETAAIPKLDHNYVPEVRLPTCTAGGYTRNNCQTCSAYFISDYTTALGHQYNYGVITEDPTKTTKGHIRYSCIRCNVGYEDTFPALTISFEDVPLDVYYTLPVHWASSVGITRGIDDAHFAPAQPCTRAQVVTFLWRRAGKPTPQSRENPFADVPADSFYEQAVLWAAQTGITTGTDSTHFSPDMICNRAQVVTFLHRFRGCPEPFLTAAFPDVPAGSFFHEAVMWAAGNEITLGMDDGLFHPTQVCNRAQIVTFLYRDAKIP